MTNYLVKIGINNSSAIKEINNVVEAFELNKGEINYEKYQNTLIIQKPGKSIRISKDIDGNIFLTLHIFVSNTYNEYNGLLQSIYIKLTPQSKKILLDEIIRYDMSNIIEESHIRDNVIIKIYPNQKKRQNISTYLTKHAEEFMAKDRIIIESINALSKQFTNKPLKEKIVKQP